MLHLLRIKLLGELTAQSGERIVARFRTQKEAALFAYLAYYPQRPHLREQLTEMLWPDVEPVTGRNRLKQTLATLRRQLEPPGVESNAVLIADRLHVRLNPAAFTTDARDFEDALRDMTRAENAASKEKALLRAVECYSGALLPDYYEDWILTERQRLADAFAGAARQMTAALEQKGEWERALDFARRAAAADNYFEEAHGDVMRLLARLNRPSEALRHYRELETRLLAELDAKPCAELREIHAQITRGDFAAPVKKSPIATIAPLSAEKISAVASNNASITDDNTSSECENSVSAALETQDARRAEANATSAAHLPTQFNRFFGRQSEIETVVALLRVGAARGDQNGAARLVTITGPGGSGKSRIALEIARRVAPQYPGGAWFVPLADITDPRQIVDAIADALSIFRDPGGETLDALAKRLREKPALLVLDNMEQLLVADNPRFKIRNPKAPDGAAFVWKLLSLAPELTCLITSRLAMELNGEQEFPLAPLPIPLAVHAAPEALQQIPSVALFIDRAQAATPDFQLTPRNAEAIATLCAKLEGIPLALELAAARVRVFSPAQMLGQLSRRFDFLVSRQRNAEERHRALSNAIEWSYYHLPPPLRDFFTRLSVFRGGWTIESAQAVCLTSAEEPEEEDGFDFAAECLSQLRIHSLIITEEQEGSYRFRMLETLREYAQACLQAEDAADAQRRHAMYFSELAREAEPHFTGPDQPQWMTRLTAEYENIQAALRWCAAEETSGEIGLRLAGAFWRFWMIRGYFRDGRDVLKKLLANPGTEIACIARGDTLSAAGNLAMHQNDYAEAQGFHERALALRRTISDRRGIAASLNNLGVIAVETGAISAARAHYEASLALFCEMGNRPIQGYVLNNLANVALKQGDLPEAIRCFRESLVINRELKSRAGEIISLFALGEIAYLQDNFPAAKTHFTQALAIARDLGSPGNEASALNNLGSLACHAGDYDSAQQNLTESLRLRRELGDKRGIASTLDGFGFLAAALGAYPLAASRLGAAEALREHCGLSPDSGDPAEYERTLSVLHKNLSDADFRAAWNQGRETPLDCVIETALNSPGKQPDRSAN